MEVDANARVNPIRLLIADDHHMFREGLRSTLELEPTIECIAEVTNGRDAVAETLRLRPDIAFLDVRMPKLDGIGATRMLQEARCPTKVLILTNYDDEATLQKTLASGASGFLLKNLPPEEILAAITIVTRGDAVIDPSIIRRLMPRLSRLLDAQAADPPDALQELTKRELDVLLLLAEALNNAEIGERLGIGEQTVKTHVSRILCKLGFRDRVQAVVFAHRHNILTEQYKRVSE
ncbi:response regulator [Mycobacteroides abscessus]|uniref:response regulator n=1 Tax=Mycobacteroides abscessus TaxID=36809 RepID=UPI000940BB9B|nr:response regulator transcription factor [Mycobacteroides abscessus]